MFKYTQAFSGFSVTDLAKAKEFYGQTLGLPVENMGDHGLQLKLNGTTVFIYAKDDHQPATFTVLNFMVDDIDKAVAELKSQGVKFESYEKGRTKTGDDNIARSRASGKGPDVAWFKDPFGNFIAVIQPL